MAGRVLRRKPGLGAKFLAVFSFILCFAAASGPGAAPPAQAQRYYYPFFQPFYPYQYRPYYRRRYAPRPRYRYRRQARPKQPEKPFVRPAWYPDDAAKDPVQLIVSIPDQRITVYQGDKELVKSRVSSGREGYPTPTGVFTILQKARYHHSNIYSRAPMPFMQRLTWSGIALHGSNDVPNRPASHGCVRLPQSFARELFRFTEKGAHVIVAKQDAAPYDIAHEALFQPRPDVKDFDQQEGERVLRLAGVKLKEAQRSTAPLRMLVTRRTGSERLMDVQRLLNELGFDAGKVDGWMGPDTAGAIMRFQRAHSLAADGLLSDPLIEAVFRAAGKGKPANGHLYVRQNFRQLFDAPIRIEAPEKPLGAHLITAMHFEPGAWRARWLAVSLIDDDAEPRREAALHKKGTATDQPPAAQPATEAVSLEETLDRLKIPEEARARIAQLLTPGSSLAISDRGLSKETFPKGTDFVVLTD